MIQPILSYTAEIWGILVDNDPTEKVHLFTCKRFLNVAARTPNEMVYREQGKQHLKIHYLVKAAKFWFRLLHMDENRIPKQAYRMLVSLSSDGKSNLVTKLRLLLHETCFGYIWLTQDVGDEQHFIHIFRQSLTAMNLQNWLAGLNFSSHFNYYLDCWLTGLKAPTN